MSAPKSSESTPLIMPAISVPAAYVSAEGDVNMATISSTAEASSAISQYTFTSAAAPRIFLILRYAVPYLPAASLYT